MRDFLKLRVGCHNIEGLNQKLDNTDLFEYVKEFHIYAFLETWRFGQNEIILENFNVIEKCKKRIGKRGRNPAGVAVLISKQMCRFIKEIKTNMDNIIWLQLDVEQTRLLIGFIYIHPDTSPYANENIFSELEEEIISLQNATGIQDCILLGDMNARTANLDEEVKFDSLSNLPLPEDYPVSQGLKKRSNPDTHINTYGRKLIEFCKSNVLHILNGRSEGDNPGNYTFVSQQGKSVIDYCLASSGCLPLIANFEVGDRAESYHFPIIVNLHFQSYQTDENVTPEIQENTYNIRRFTWKEDESQSFSAWFNHFSYAFLIGIKYYALRHDTDTSAEMLKNMMQMAGSDMEKKKPVRKLGISRGWFDCECKRAKSKVLKSLRNFRKKRNEELLSLYLADKETYKEILKDKKQKAKLEKENKIKDLYETKDSRSLWSTLKSIINSNSSTSPNIPTQKWVEHFRKVLNPLQNVVRPEWLQPRMEPQVDRILDKTITSLEITLAIRSTQGKKAPGHDGVPGEFYKQTVSVITDALVHLFNAILTSGKYPASWTKAVIFTIYKNKGEKLDPNNYRGISLLPTISKIFTRILNTRLYEWVSKNNILSECQAGFRRGYSTVDNIFILDTLITSSLRKKRGKLYCCFVDYQKAFDTVNRNALWYKLHGLGVSHKFIKLLKNMYSDISFAIKTDFFSISEEIESKQGVLQGCLLSPLLFSIFINDIVDFLNIDSAHAPLVGGSSIHALLYADDLVLCSTTKVGLQNLLNKLSNYCKYWHMQVNISKTKVMVFKRGGGRLAAYEKWYLDGSPVEIVDHFKYLGMTLSSNGSWLKNNEVLNNQAQKALFQIKKLVYKTPNCPVKLFLHIFDTAISPIILYGSEICGPYWKQNIEKVPLAFLKFLLKAPRSTPNAGILLELGRLKLKAIALKRSVNYWHRILKMEYTRLVKQCYLKQKDWASKNVGCWGLEIKKTLINSRLELVWQNQEQCTNADVKLLVRNLMEQSFNELLADANRLTSLSHYTETKETLGFEPYLQEVDTPILRKCLLSFRLGVFYNQIIRQDEVRLCKLCEQPVNNMQSHIFRECSQLQLIREKYNLHLIDPSLNPCQLIELAGSELAPIIAKFLQQSYKKFEEKEIQSLEDVSPQV